MSEDHVEDLRPHDRRRFFREGLGRIIGPVADYIEESVSKPARTLLRPPGALPEDAFLDTCYRCGSCVTACPAAAIRQYQTDEQDLAGTPYIDPDIAPCVVCNALACMSTCQSGALRQVASTELGMGVAQVNTAACLLAGGSECGMCVAKCPIGSAAIRLSDDGHVEVVEAGCVGCGVCQSECPTVPKAITVTPAD